MVAGSLGERLTYQRDRKKEPTANVSIVIERGYKGKLRHSSGCFQGKARELSIAPMWMWGVALLGEPGLGVPVLDAEIVSAGGRSTRVSDAIGCSVTGFVEGD